MSIMDAVGWVTTMDNTELQKIPAACKEKMILICQDQILTTVIASLWLLELPTELPVQGTGQKVLALLDYEMTSGTELGKIHAYAPR